MGKDLRRYAQQTNFRLAAGGILLLLLVGDGLIYVFYGPRAAALGLLCLVLGLFPILLIVLSLGLLEWLVKKADQG